MGKVTDILNNYQQVLEAIQSFNHNTLRPITQWMSQETYDASVCGYGIFENPFLANGIEENLTYTDVMGLFAIMLKDVSYLELGISAGKNFWQMANMIDGKLVGMDIEEINPVLHNLLQYQGITQEWPPATVQTWRPGKGRRTIYETFTPTCRSYTHDNKPVWYLRGDKRQDEPWEGLKQFAPFNLVFSDAGHSADSIWREHQMWQKYELLDRDNFAIFWDDLAGPMIPTFGKIATELKADMAEIIHVRGSYGMLYEDVVHNVGVALKS